MGRMLSFWDTICLVTICLSIKMKYDIVLGSEMMNDFLEKTNEHFAFLKILALANCSFKQNTAYNKTVTEASYSL